MKRIVIRTFAYNAERTLKRTIQSIQNQTYQNYVWYIIENGSTDKTREIIQQYAASDERIQPIYFDENRTSTQFTIGIFYDILAKHTDNEYFCTIDSDDTYDPGFFEEMLAFMKQYDLDIAACGSKFVDSVTNAVVGRRILPQTLLLEGDDFPQYYPYYHEFTRTIWGKLFSFSVLRKCDFSEIVKISYGNDTFFTTESFRNAERVGILSKVLHTYYIHKKSVSYNFDTLRVVSDQIVYKESEKFLSRFGSTGVQNRHFLQLVYANALSDTLVVIHNSDLSPTRKLKECRAAAEHRITRETYRENQNDECVKRSWETFFFVAVQAGAALNDSGNEDIRFIMQMLLPHCGRVINGANIGLLGEDRALLEALHNDDSLLLAERLLKLIQERRYTKQFDLVGMLQALAVDQPLLFQINDMSFLQKYGALYLAIWRGDRMPVLEEMTGLLLENKVSKGKETFLELYVSLAAAQNQPSAFVFGKLRQAEFCLEQGRKEDCAALLDELEEMGLTDSEELLSLREALEQS